VHALTSPLLPVWNGVSDEMTSPGIKFRPPTESWHQLIAGCACHIATRHWASLHKNAQGAYCDGQFDNFPTLWHEDNNAFFGGLQAFSKRPLRCPPEEYIAM